MWNDPTRTLEEELAPGERLIWSGQPRRGLRLRGSDVFLIPFSILWCGFAIVWEVGATLATARATAPVALIFPLFGIPFVLAGLYMVFGRFVVDARLRARTFYGLTTERIIIVSGLFGRRTRSLNLRTLDEISLTERPDGSGTISFGPSHPFAHWFAPGWTPGLTQFAPPSFEFIDRAKDVSDLIRRMQKSAS